MGQCECFGRESTSRRQEEDVCKQKSLSAAQKEGICKQKPLSATLDELALEYGTDKSSKHHNYAQFYDRILKASRSRNIRLLEVGIGTVNHSAPSSMSFLNRYKPGASLRMWQRYFENAEVIAGIDTQEDCMFTEGRIQTALADSRCHESAAKALANIGFNTFDIILDDGLHEEAANVATLQCLHRYLSPDGVYIVEDVRRPWQLLPKLQAVLPTASFHVESLQSLKPKRKLVDSNAIVIFGGSSEQLALGSVAHYVRESLLESGGLVVGRIHIPGTYRWEDVIVR